MKIISSNCRNSKFPVIGLVGGIGSGKSHAARILSNLGANTINADEVVHNIFEEEKFINSVALWWPEVIEKNKVNRTKLAGRVFISERDLGRLEGLLWPRVIDLTLGTIENSLENSEVTGVVLDAPMLIESGMHTLCDTIIFIDADTNTRLERVRARGWQKADLIQREATQLPIEKKKELSDVIVQSNSNLEKNLVHALSKFWDTNQD